MALSETIKRAREKHGFSQEFIAEQLGVSRQAVSKWETGQSQPSMKNLRRLAQLLSLDVAFLLNGSGEIRRSVKDNIPQNGIRTVLSKRNAILLTASCTAQMMIFCVNQGTVNQFKYIMSGVSSLLMVLLLTSIWFTTDAASRNSLYVRVFWFALAFNTLLIASSHYVGGLIALVLAILFLVSLIKVHNPRKG